MNNLSEKFIRRSPQALLSLHTRSGTLHLEVYHRLRQLILAGSWPPGTRLPSSRTLARDLGISRNTALVAIDKLVADGWIIARSGSGMYVSFDAPTRGTAQPTNVDKTGSETRRPVPFEISEGATDLFPVDEWARIQSRLWRKASDLALHEGAGQGWKPLRRSIAGYLHAVRGLSVAADRILIMPSTQAAIDLSVRVLARFGDSICVEDPGYPYAQDAFDAHGLKQVPIEVDGQGIVIGTAPIHGPRPRLAYVTPACQFPTGAILSESRRKDLLSWAANEKAYILEDDWDFNARFDGDHPAEPLAAASFDNVVFIHSFNRILFPALRIAALIVPDAMLTAFVEARLAIDRSPNMANQMALAEFIDRGLLSAHLRTLRLAYGARRRALHSAVKRELDDHLWINKDQSGLHALAFLRSGRDSDLADRARSRGIACLALSEFVKSPRAQHQALLLGFGSHEAPSIDLHVGRLARALRAGD